MTLLAFSSGLSAVDLPVTARLSNATVPPGGTAQIRISLDTPQTVSEGSFAMDFDPTFFDDITDVQVWSAAGDVRGIATIKGRHLEARFSSPSAGIGRLPDAPVITVSLPVLSTVAAGARAAVTFTQSDRSWVDPSGNRFLLNIVPGMVTAGDALTIQKVTPGGGLLPAGTTVHLTGSGFRSDTSIDIPGVAISSGQFVSSSEMTFTLLGPTDLTGKRVVATSPSSTSAEFVSYLRATSTSSDPQKERLQPFFPLRTYSAFGSGIVPSSAVATIGLALQNQNQTTVTLQVEGRDGIGGLSSRTEISLAPAELYIVPDVTTIGAVGYRAQVGIRSSQPIQALILSTPRYNNPIDAYLPFTPYEVFVTPEVPVKVTDQNLTFFAQAGTSTPLTETIYARAAAPSFEIKGFTSSASGGSWLSVTPSKASLASSGENVPLTVIVNPAGLKVGVYTGAISVLSDLPGAKPSVSPVTLTVIDQPYIYIPVQPLTGFNIGSDNPTPLTQTFTVASYGASGPLAITASTEAGGNWLSVTPSTASTPATVSFSVDPSKLAPGSYYRGAITIKGPGNTVLLPVSVWIPPTLPPPVSISLTPPSLAFSLQKDSTQGIRSFPVYVSSGRQPWQITSAISSGGNWLAATVPSSSYGDNFMVLIDTGSLAPGTYTGSVTVSSANATAPAILPVKLTVWSGTTPALTVTPASLAIGQNLEMVGNGEEPSIMVTSGDLPLAVTAKADVGGVCSAIPVPLDPMDQGYPEPLTPAKVLVRCSGKPGEYSGTVTIVAGTNSVVVPVAVRIPPTSYYSGPTTPPVLASISNAASGSVAGVSPGELISLYGVGIGPRTSAFFSLNSGRVPTTLSGVRVLFDGIPAPILFASLFQTNVIVPYEVANRRTTTIEVEVNGIKSSISTVPVLPAAPAVFTRNASGKGGAAVLNQDNVVNSPDTPATRGSVIQIYATGQGQTAPGGVTGEVVGRDTKRPILPVRVTISGIEAQILYAGSAPELVSGLLQVNAVIPMSAEVGNAVPISLTIGEATSPIGPTIAIH